MFVLWVRFFLSRYIARPLAKPRPPPLSPVFLKLRHSPIAPSIRLSPVPGVTMTNAVRRGILAFQDRKIVLGGTFCLDILALPPGIKKIKASNAGGDTGRPDSPSIFLPIMISHLWVEGLSNANASSSISSASGEASITM